MRTCVTLAFLFWSLASSSHAAVLTFEGFAPPGGLVNVSPTTPYHEAGYTLTPLNAASAAATPASPRVVNTQVPGSGTELTWAPVKVNGCRAPGAVNVN